MTSGEPRTELDPRFSAEGAQPTEWNDGRHQLAEAEIYWLSTVRPDGRPHVTPLIAVWLDDALFFCTGPTERKARNLLQNQNCIITTGKDTLNAGLDVVIEGRAVMAVDNRLLQRVAAAYESKYGSDWHFDVVDGAFLGDGGTALVFEVEPSKAFGFARGEYSQTRWAF